MLLAALSLALALALPARARCPEPSPIDLQPTAIPLRVDKPVPWQLEVSWEPVAASGYRLLRGTLATLSTPDVYDHVTIEETTDTSVVSILPSIDYYYLVTASCPPESSSVGRDSDDSERPVGGLAEIFIDVTIGIDVFGIGFTMTHPTGDLITSDALVQGVGAPGLPFFLVNAMTPGEVHATYLFLNSDPALGFDAPTRFCRIRYAYYGAPPRANDFVLTDCGASTWEGTGVDPLTCETPGFNVLY